MEERTQFTFYDSFAKALKRIRKAADRALAYDAIVEYALYSKEPDLDKLPDAAAIAFEVAKPVLDASRKKAKAGQLGGSKRGSKDEADASRSEAKRKQNEESTNQGQEKEQVKGQDKEQMLYTPPPNGVGVYRQPTPSKGAVDAYMRAISPTPSTASMRELMDFEEKLGTELCYKAIDQALDANVKTWPYVKAILKSYQDRGFKTLDDVQQAEAQRMQRKDKAQDPSKPVVMLDDIEVMFREAQRANGLLEAGQDDDFPQGGASE